MIRFIRSADVLVNGRFGRWIFRPVDISAQDVSASGYFGLGHFGPGRFGQWIFRTRTFWPVDSSDKDVSASGYFGLVMDISANGRFCHWIFRPRTFRSWTFRTRTFRTMDPSQVNSFFESKLKDRFDFGLKEEQSKLISQILQGKNSLWIFPTEFGKSVFLFVAFAF